ncbi:MAG TPA: hypothetical protein VLJ42_03620 [Solirubrobacteraceae bacterium]|nr:hypothetical protein [Solirubrobacteraceae bacterium]
MSLDRQTIEKRDFPISRRGYDPAAVDAHLRALASEIDELERAADSRGGETLGSTAGTQVQSILEAAEATAADIERQAAESARKVRNDADAAAEQTRSEAVRRAQAHVAAVSQATSILLQRVDSMDSEASGLIQSLRAGAARLATDLAAVETNMGELYDAASGNAPASGNAHALGVQPSSQRAFEDVATEAVHPFGEPARTVPTPTPVAAAEPPAERELAAPLPVPLPDIGAPPAPAATSTGLADSGDLDGARLIALNMALNGESREQTDRYLADNFQLGDRAKLLDEVYAAIEG